MNRMRPRVVTALAVALAAVSGTVPAATAASASGTGDIRADIRADVNRDGADQCSGYRFNQSVGVMPWPVRTWRFFPSAASTT